MSNCSTNRTNANLDPQEVLTYLNELGYNNISAQQLKEFMKDLKKLIKYDIKKSIEVIEKENLRCDINKSIDVIRKENFDIPCTSKPKPKQGCGKSCNCNQKRASRQKSSDSTNCKNRSSHYQNSRDSSNCRNHSPPPRKSSDSINCKNRSSPHRNSRDSCNSRNLSPTVRKSCDSKNWSRPYVPNYVDDIFSNLYSASTVSSRAKSSIVLKVPPPNAPQGTLGVSFAPKKTAQNSDPSIQSSYYTDSDYQSQPATSKYTSYRPKSFIRPTLSLHSCKSDPVSLYQRYKEDWKKHKAPGENEHKQLRWAIREKMLGQPDIQPVPSSRKVRL